MAVKYEKFYSWIVLLGILLAVSLLMVGSLRAQEKIMDLETSAGRLRITAIGHGSLMFEFGDVLIHVDPYSRAGDYANLPKADQIWITHAHPDHLDLVAIDQIKKEGTLFVADPESAEKLGDSGVIVMQNWDKRDIDGIAMEAQYDSLSGATPFGGFEIIPVIPDKRDIDGITIEAVPAYNLVREREPGVKFHPKGWGNGYVATFGDKRVYIAGDTENIPEMAYLGLIDVAFIPIDGRYTMSPEEAVGCIKVISPKVVIPYHQGQSDPNVIAELLKGSSIEVRVLPLP